MMFKKMLILTLALLIALPAITSAKEVKKLNVAPLMKVPKKGISSAEKLKSMFETYQDRIKEGFEKAGMGSCFPEFMDKVKTVEIKDTVIPKGQKFPWMLFYSHKQVKIINDVEWAGKKTFNAFTFTISCDADCKDYEFIVPKICGNLTLFNQKSSLAVCNTITPSPAEGDAGSPVKLTLSGKCDASYEVTVSLNGKDVFSQKVAPGTKEVSITDLAEPGQYTARAKAINADGIPSQNECTATFVLRAVKANPVCDLKVTPMEGRTGKTFKFDASGSSDKDGKVVKADFTLTGPTADQQSVAAEPFVWNKKIKKAGTYSAQVKVTDNDGNVSAPCTVDNIHVKGTKLNFLGEIGPMLAKGTYTGYIFGRLGLMFPFDQDRWDVLVSAGYAVKLSGERFKSHFLSNLMLNYHMSALFIGAGMGYSSRVRTDNWKAGFNFIGNIGYDINIGGHKGAIFGEVRLPVVAGLPLSDAHEFLLGLRYRF
ncbi:MAG: hypothetical protein ACM3SY_05330 [Candidatus Omnitrophota bacterium]